jgi:hypothetical protein
VNEIVSIILATAAPDLAGSLRRLRCGSWSSPEGSAGMPIRAAAIHDLLGQRHNQWQRQLRHTVRLAGPTSSTATPCSATPVWTASTGPNSDVRYPARRRHNDGGLQHAASAADRGDAASGIVVHAAPAARPVHLALLVVNLPPTVQPESAQQCRRHASTVGHPVLRHKHPIRRA